MNKIIAVSLIADSADIVESFVRHTLTYADEMLVVDHAASDGTDCPSASSATMGRSFVTTRS